MRMATSPSSQASNSPQNITLHLTVLAGAPLHTDYKSLYFISQGGADPAPQPTTS